MRSPPGEALSPFSPSLAVFGPSTHDFFDPDVGESPLLLLGTAAKTEFRRAAPSGQAETLSRSRSGTRQRLPNYCPALLHATSPERRKRRPSACLAKPCLLHFVAFTKKEAAATVANADLGSSTLIRSEQMSRGPRSPLAAAF